MPDCIIYPMEKPTYTIPPGETQRQHNAKIKAALELLNSDDEIREQARIHALTDLRNIITEQIIKAGHELSNNLLAYGVQLCPNTASVWIADQLEKNVSGITEWLAGFAYCDGDSKANLARAVGIRQQSYKTHFPQLEQIAAAQDKADQTGEPQDILIHGDPFTIYPTTPTNNNKEKTQ